ncbi:hypothetical protein [Photobacterium lucens]|uniref:hypothetical protein n=1 Tax=Photobacterium lucens TaxID=2562949 RepID=UPI00136DEC9E|nr:hypothetical protein [Photobacterium lucens]MBP2699593.1 hypothetical protein [Vibrio parahaemolyticus]MZG56896.1 hypothetical protein [Photobacterium lucens]MZG81657.1 hypothetical protein [Photobacterium lucens]
MFSLFTSLSYYLFLLISGLLLLILTPSTLVYADAYKMLVMMTMCSCVIIWLLFIYFLVTKKTFRKSAFTRVTKQGNKVFSIAPVFSFFIISPLFLYVLYIKILPCFINVFPLKMTYQPVTIKNIVLKGNHWCIEPEEFTQFMNDRICDIPTNIADKISFNDQVILVGKKTDLSFSYYSMVVNQPELDFPIMYHF